MKAQLIECINTRSSAYSFVIVPFLLFALRLRLTAPITPIVKVMETIRQSHTICLTCLSIIPPTAYLLDRPMRRPQASEYRLILEAHILT